MVGHLGHGDVQVVRHEAQDGEDDEAGVHTGGAVGHADDDAVSVCGDININMVGCLKAFRN